LRRIVIPFLQEEHAGFRAGMRFEGVDVQADDRQNPRPLRDKLPNLFVRGVVEPSLRQHNRQAAARFQKIQIALDEQNIPADFGLWFVVLIVPQFVFVDNPRFFDVPGKRRISHQDIKAKFFVGVLVFFQAFKTDQKPLP